MQLAEVEEKMGKAIEATQRAFNTIRTGRANAALLDRISVDYYGAATPLKSLAGINVPDSSTIAIQPFDMSAMDAIERAISMSDLGLTPNNDGKVIRLNIPPLTSERRKQLAKQASGYAEEGKVAIRNIRRDGMDSVKKQEKASDISKDEARDLQDAIQKLTDSYVKKIDAVLAEKEKDIMTV
ncbi:MAG: ribosome recycling factor [Geitlerinemataceae cyanobacterium]